MGFQIEVDGRTYNAIDFNVTEQATPLAGDSLGSIGSFDITIPIPDPSAFGVRGGEILSRQNIYRYPRPYAASPGIESAGDLADLTIPDAPSGRSSVLEVTQTDDSALLYVLFSNIPASTPGTPGIIPVAPNRPMSISVTFRAPEALFVYGFIIPLRADGSPPPGGQYPATLMEPGPGWDQYDWAFATRSNPDIPYDAVLPRDTPSITAGFYAFAQPGVTLEIDQVRIGYDVSTGVFDGWTPTEP